MSSVQAELDIPYSEADMQHFPVDSAVDIQRSAVDIPYFPLSGAAEKVAAHTFLGPGTQQAGHKPEPSAEAAMLQSTCSAAADFAKAKDNTH
jgi:hypothetical protein